MSDWEIDNSPYEAKQSQKSNWEIEQPYEINRPTFGQAVVQAPSKIYEDVTGGIKNFLTNIPNYYESAKTEIPGIKSAFSNNPRSALNQVGAGISELGQNVFNAPHDVIRYLSERLNLVPEDINKMVQMGRMPEDTTNLINQQFGLPQQAGESLIRGIPRNVLNIAGLKGVASLANPSRYTSGGITKNVMREADKQMASHTKQYNKIWSKADKSGFNQVPVNMNSLLKDFDILEKYKTPREYQALSDFMKNPTLQNAQKAQSDMGVIARALEKKSRKSSLLSEEKSIFDAAKGAEKHIEENMFKNSKGEINKSLQKEYNNLTKSYRKNVVPYKYNPAIQAYKAEEITAPELVNALSHGAFARQKGFKHPAIKINKSLPKAGYLGGGLLAGKYLFGSGEEERPSRQ